NGKVKEIYEEQRLFKQRADFLQVIHGGHESNVDIKMVFDIEGRLLEYEKKIADSCYYSFESNNYDLNGNLLLRKSIDEGYNKRIKQNTYDFNNKLIQTKGYNGKGRLIYSTDYFYSTNNNLEKSVTKFDDIINTEIFKYDSEGRLIESTLYRKQLNN